MVIRRRELDCRETERERGVGFLFKGITEK